LIFNGFRNFNTRKQAMLHYNNGATTLFDCILIRPRFESIRLLIRSTYYYVFKLEY